MRKNTYKGFGKNTAATPQTEAIPGREQDMAQNNAGGVSFVVDDLVQFRRFLILGVEESGTYYVNERKLVKDNLKALERLMKAGRGKEAVDLVVEVSQGGLAPKNDAALFALARLASSDIYGTHRVRYPERTSEMHRDHHTHFFTRFPYEGCTITIGRKIYKRRGDTILITNPPSVEDVLDERDIQLRQYALSKIAQVARIGTHWFHFYDYLKEFRGHGPTYQTAMRALFNNQTPDRLAYQFAKYRQREGVSIRDLLREAKPRPETMVQSLIYRWATKGWKSDEVTDIPVWQDQALSFLWAVDQAALCYAGEEHNEDRLIGLIRDYRLPWECVPTQARASVPVLHALLESMPMEASMRQLGSMTSRGVFARDNAVGEKALTIVLDRFANQEAIKHSRLHPFDILVALMTYQQGHGQKGHGAWEPVREIVEALDRAFYLAFGNVTPTGVVQTLALDVSGSMCGPGLLGTDLLTPRVASAALALVTASVEPKHRIMGFSHQLVEISITPEMKLERALRIVDKIPMGGTDCALPIADARLRYLANQHSHGTEYARAHAPEAFVVYTDSEMWAGHIHPAQELKQYRTLTGIPAKLAVVAMTSTGFSIADPKDRGMLDCVGLDTSTPSLLSSFIRGDV